MSWAGGPDPDDPHQGGDRLLRGVGGRVGVGRRGGRWAGLRMGPVEWGRPTRQKWGVGLIGGAVEGCGGGGR